MSTLFLLEPAFGLRWLYQVKEENHELVHSVKDFCMEEQLLIFFFLATHNCLEHCQRFLKERQFSVYYPSWSNNYSEWIARTRWNVNESRRETYCVMRKDVYCKRKKRQEECSQQWKIRRECQNTTSILNTFYLLNKDKSSC